MRERRFSLEGGLARTRARDHTTVMRTLHAQSDATQMARPRFSTIRARVLAVVLLTMLPAFALIVFNAVDERTRAMDITRQSALSTVRLVAAEQSQIIASTRQVMQVIANSDQVMAGDPAACESYLNRIYETMKGFKGLSVARANGDVYCIAPRRELTQTLNTAYRSYFQKVLATNDFAIGDFQVGQITGTPNISFGYPVRDARGEIKAVVWAGLSIDRLNDLAQDWRLPSDTSVVVMDSKGTVVTRFPQWQDWVGKQFPTSELFKHMQANTEGTTRLPGLDGLARWFAFTTIGADSVEVGTKANPVGSVLYLAAGYSDAAFMQDVNGRLVLSLAALGLLSVLGVTIASGMTDWMIGRRARQIMATTRELQLGNWAARTNMTLRDGELGELGRTLDEMADALRERDLKLQSINAELEERVAARTSELATANGQLRTSQDALRRLSQDLLSLSEQERARVADDVSERLGQGLTGIKMDLSLAQRLLAAERDDEALAHVRSAQITLDGMVQAARQIAGELRPSVLDDFGLTAAVEGQIGDFRRETGIVADLNAAVDETRLDAATKTAAFRVLQEALANVALHAHAAHVSIHMRTDDRDLSLIVQDDGGGFQPGDLLKPQALGVLEMRERAIQLDGALSVTAQPGEGAKLALTLPISDRARAGSGL